MRENEQREKSKGRKMYKGKEIKQKGEIMRDKKGEERVEGKL